MTSNKIFISHRSTDKEIAEMLLDFFATTGLPTDSIFCSSLPGNDVKNKISEEIKQAIKGSAVNLVILSNEYYQSAYCLNEEGIIWFYDTPVIVIAMPEIRLDNMLGFLRDEYKIRRLDSEDDIATIYDLISSLFQTSRKTATSLNHEIRKLKKRYLTHINNRKQLEEAATLNSDEFNDITTDDEKVVLYYLISQKIRKIQNDNIKQWMTENEIYDINITNALDLLSAAGWGILKSEGTLTSFELDISYFRTLAKASDKQVEVLHKAVRAHCHLSKDQFRYMWDENQFNDRDLLFISYMIDEGISSFGDRWMTDAQIEHIKFWEGKNYLEALLSEAYSKCLSKFIDNKLVYESSWTSYGNPREYTLHKSLKSFLMKSEFPYDDALESTKGKYIVELPF